MITCLRGPNLLYHVEQMRKVIYINNMEMLNCALDKKSKVEIKYWKLCILNFKSFKFYHFNLGNCYSSCEFGCFVSLFGCC